MLKKRKSNKWEGVKFVKDKSGNITGKKIYDYKTGKLLKTEKVFYLSKTKFKI